MVRAPPPWCTLWGAFLESFNLFILRERVCVCACGRGRERERTQSAEPNAGLEPMKRELTTGAEIKSDIPN